MKDSLLYMMKELFIWYGNRIVVFSDTCIRLVVLSDESIALYDEG